MLVFRSPSVNFSDLLPVDDDPRAIRNLVIKLHRSQVGLVSVPVYALRSGGFCPLIDRLDQRAPDSLAPRGLRGEEILQIAARANHDRAAMKYVMNQTEEAFIFLRNQGMHGLIGVKEARPSHPRNIIWQRRRAHTPVKAVIAFPKAFPLNKVCGEYRTNNQRVS